MRRLTPLENQVANLIIDLPQPEIHITFQAEFSKQKSDCEDTNLKESLNKLKPTIRPF